MRLRCVGCGEMHEVEASRFASFLCVGCLPFNEEQRRRRRYWLRGKHDAWKHERNRKRAASF
jgi:hypothetical protein